MKTIYNTYVVMESQEQCDRMKQLCIDNGLPIWEWEYAFLLTKPKVFEYDNTAKEFYCNSTKLSQEIEVTEEEFIELLKTK